MVLCYNTGMRDYKRLVSLRLVLCLGLAVAAGLSAGAQGRLALVIGNSDYKSAPVLANPATDALALTTALEDAGFAVISRTDLDKAGLDAVFAEFRKLLPGKETALLYFAGYAVQVQGTNRLIATNGVITGPEGVNVFSLGVEEVLAAIRQAGVKTAIVLLDAARSNPFPAFAPEYPKGYAHIVAPEGLETLFGYSSTPGTVAADVRGRNSQFTGALLKNLSPGIEITELMRNVRTEVMFKTNNAQKPFTQSRLTKPFVFQAPQVLTPAPLAAATPAPAEAVPAASAVTAAPASPEPQRPAPKTPQDDLFRLAESYRQRLAEWSRKGLSDNPDDITRTIQELEGILDGLEAEYTKVQAAGLRQLESQWDARLAELEKDQPQPWESDDDFTLRSKNDKARLRKDKTTDLMRFRGDCDTQKVIMTASVKKTLDDVLLGLKNRTWRLEDTRVGIQALPYDRNAKVWDFVLSSVDPLVPVEALTLSVDLGVVADIKTAWGAIDAVVRANTLAASLTWGIERQVELKRYALVVREAKLWNSADTAGGQNPPLIGQLAKPVVTAYFQTGKLAEAISAMGNLAVTATAGVDIYIDGRKSGTGNWSGKLWEGSHRVAVRSADGGYGLFEVQVEPGQTKNLAAAVRYYKPGDVGPAGGIVFYDKGSFSDGWRWLEAAAQDAPAGLAWYNGIHLDISGAKAKGPGSGRANTRAVVVAQGPGSYAAQYCEQLELGGFDDWFLPSKDELDLLYRSLKSAGSGKAGNLAGKLYWSSSQYSNYGSSYDAWRQDFGSGEPSFGNAKEALAVRAVRAF